MQMAAYQTDVGLGDRGPREVRSFPDEVGPENNLLAYGTLAFPGVIEVLLGYVPPSVPCEAYDCHLSPKDWAVIDDFEDPRYDVVEVATSRGPALVYASRDERMKRAGEWDPSVFRAEHLGDYVHMCRRWRRRLEDSGRLQAT